MPSRPRSPVFASLFVPLGVAALWSGQARAEDEEHAPPPVEPGVVVATLPEGVELPAASVTPAEPAAAASAPAGPHAGNLLGAGTVPQGTESAEAAPGDLALPAPAAPPAGPPAAAPARPPAGWTTVQEPGASPSPSGWAPVDDGATGAERPAPPGWTAAGGQDEGASTGAEGWRPATPQAEPSVATADRRLAVGGSLGGAGILSADVLVRLGPTWTFDAGLGLRNTFVEQDTRGMIVAGMSWQAGERRSRHGLYGRAGVVPDEQEGGEILGSVGYAWRLLPRRGALSFSLEAGPVWMAAMAPDPGEPAAWLLPYVRVGMHAWLKDGS